MPITNTGGGSYKGKTKAAKKVTKLAEKKRAAPAKKTHTGATVKNGKVTPIAWTTNPKKDIQAEIDRVMRGIGK